MNDNIIADSRLKIIHPVHHVMPTNDAPLAQKVQKVQKECTRILLQRTYCHSQCAAKQNSIMLQGRGGGGGGGYTMYSAKFGGKENYRCNEEP